MFRRLLLILSLSFTSPEKVPDTAGPAISPSFRKSGLFDDQKGADGLERNGAKPGKRHLGFHRPVRDPQQSPAV